MTMPDHRKNSQSVVASLQTVSAQHPQFVMMLVLFSLTIAVAVAAGTVDNTWITPQAAHGISNGP